MTRRLMTLLPAFAWIAVQFAMSLAVVSLPVRADGTLDREQFRELMSAGVAEIVICSPSGPIAVDLSGDKPDDLPQAADTGCKWCQGFGTSVLPAPPTSSVMVRLVPTPVFLPIERPKPGFSGVFALGFASRAPPV